MPTALADAAGGAAPRIPKIPASVAAAVKLNVVSRSDNELEVEVHGENETLLNPIKQALLADKDVDFAEYIIEHPSLSVPKIFVRTKGKAKPDAVLKRTLQGLIAEFDAFETAFAAQLKQQRK